MTRILDLRGHDTIKRTVGLLDGHGQRDGARTTEVCDIEVQATLMFSMDLINDLSIDHARPWRVYWWAKAELERN